MTTSDSIKKTCKIEFKHQSFHFSYINFTDIFMMYHPQFNRIHIYNKLRQIMVKAMSKPLVHP